jgi:hypothetical protein
MQGLHVFDPQATTIIDLESFVHHDHFLRITLLMPGVMLLSYGLMHLMGTPLPAPQFTVSASAAMFVAFFVSVGAVVWKEDADVARGVAHSRGEHGFACVVVEPAEKHPRSGAATWRASSDHHLALFPSVFKKVRTWSLMGL